MVPKAKIDPDPGVGQYVHESIFNFSHTNEFVGIKLPAAEAVRASPPPQPGRWVYEEGGSTAGLQGGSSHCNPQ